VEDDDLVDAVEEMPVSSSETAKPSGVLRAISEAPMFEVMITMA
jgi:hypothetical protein